MSALLMMFRSRVVVGEEPPAGGSAVLLESGDSLLLEDGSALLVEDA